MEYLVESALLTHGLKSVSNETIKKEWQDQGKKITWIDHGKIRIGDIDEFLEFRSRASAYPRIDCDLLEKALSEQQSGALTASGTMAVCVKMGIPVAITCGMGGIGDIKGEELCPDLPALQQIPVVLISAGPKDMLDRKATIDWLISHGVKVIGTERNYCTGYVFCGEKVELQGKTENVTETVKPPMLIINEIPEERRIEDREILRVAIAEGKRAEKEGRYFHPAANGKIDDCTDGYSSLIQLRGLIANMKVAEAL